MGIGVLNALSIDDDKTGFVLTFVLLSRFFDQFFLRLGQECCCLLRQARSISEIGVDGALFGKVMGQRSPLATCS